MSTETIVDSETIKRLVLCGTKIQDWQVGIVDNIIDILNIEGGLSLIEICCVAYQNKSIGWCDGIKNARGFVQDVKDVLSTLYGDGVLEMKDERYWLMGEAP